MNDEEILKACETVVTGYLNTGDTIENYAEICEIRADKTHKRLKQHIQGVIGLLEKGLEIIERDDD